MSTPIDHAPHPPVTDVSDMPLWEGRAFGGIVLAAFLLYGIGSAAADQPIGVTLVVVNSIAVAFAGLIGFRLIRSTDRSVGVGYVVARVTEAVLLAGGIILAELADVGDADNVGYLLAMIALAAGSIPFCRTLGRRRWIPQPLATWGMYGYATLAIGALLELMTERSLTMVLALPGGLFELVLGLHVVRFGFRRPTRHPEAVNRARRSQLEGRSSSPAPGRRNDRCSHNGR